MNKNTDRVKNNFAEFKKNLELPPHDSRFYSNNNTEV